ncbi:hypothetical protein HUJ04_000666 [Dendroctonus ponderosae]|nr:hypothetical protein HUJ04_000666 [Dendroctonus ponderosae]
MLQIPPVKGSSTFKISVRGSPFELLENYIEGFEKNVDHLRSYLKSGSWQQKTLQNYIQEEAHIKDIGEYDFIIVGGGTTGSVIAARLSEIPEWKILLLEAGESESVASKVPVMHSCLKGESSPLTWGYYSVPQNNSCLNLEDRRCFVPTAKALGGTSAINDMLYTRGTARDYDLWADNNLKGWCSISLEPYFKNIEDAHLDTAMDIGLHHYGGPVHLESSRYYSDITNRFLAGAKEIGLKEIDVNGKNPLGFGCPQLMTKNGERYSAASAYLKSAKDRKNLEIRSLVQVTKLIIGEHTKEAQGVHFFHEGQLFTASASKEVILAAGTINSGKLLLLSGIGPHDELKPLNIECLSDLKVGKNLIHHVVFAGLKYVYVDANHLKTSGYYSKEIDYLRNGRGPLTSTGVDVIGFIKTEFSKGRHLYPDVELLVTSSQIGDNLSNKISEENIHDLKKQITINLILLHPKSRGTLSLHTNNPFDYPLINLNDFSDKEDYDIKTLLSAIRTTQKLLQSQHLQPLGLSYQGIIPRCSEYDVYSDDYWTCAIKQLSISIGEVTSSAPMGEEKEGSFGSSVVDLKLRVHGIDKLRVADDSVIPVSISGHLAAIKMVIDNQYDFIIIGSGSAGSVIASRLSEIPEWNILLIEYGEKPTVLNEIPITAPIYQVAGDYNWNYLMEKQDNFCLAMEDQLCAWPRGKALGGSTVLNYMIYTRGHADEYNKWGVESPGWSYKDVLPYFLKSENCRLETECSDPYHASGGLLSVEHPYHSELTDRFIAAGKELGFEEVDYNSHQIMGFSKIQATHKLGRRQSSATAFLNSALKRENLKILENTKVTKVLIDPTTKTAYGVEMMRNGQTFSVNASKEVILSAGVLNSPQLLMLSGIGPRDHLSELGIRPIIEDLPVGQKLYDHIAFAGMLFLINKQIEPRSLFYHPSSLLDWLFRGKGFWTSLGGIEALAYLSTKNETVPDIELLLNGIGSLQFDRGIFSRPELRITHKLYNEYFKPIENQDVFSIMPMLLHPRSVGSLKLRSKNPDDPPLCYGNYLTDVNKEDLGVLIKSIRIMEKLVDSESFKELEARVYDKGLPGCEHFVFDSDSYWECAIRHLGVTLHHQISTCKMGNGTDAVVDNELKVKGVKNLRVADTSVIPMTLSAHTSAPTMMIGKKYDFIIVGSGAAGSVIANRLSEVEKWNILILETGIPETEIMKIPSFAPMSQFSPYNWGYFTEYQEGYFFGLNRNRMRWPRGRALGGSSTINYMIYTRGNRWDYDKWAEAGNQGWSYNDVLPYFIKSEKARNLTDYNPELHGNHGLLSVENVYKTKLLDAFIEAGAELGLELIDYNANLKSFGVSRLQATVKRGRRHSVASAFLWPARNRANLDIIIDAHVTKVLINPTTKAAYGVTYSKNGQKYSVFAKKEVILSAGTFNSPQLLMLSGIGPKDHLEKLGIKVLEDLPVGRNLQDHIAFPGLSFEIDQAVDLNIRETIQQISEFIDNGTGLLTSLGGSEGIGFIKTAVADYPEDYPDMELLFIGGTLASDYGLSTYRGMNIKDEVFDSVFRPLFDKHAWTIFPMLLHPKSVGYMELKSKDPFDYPRFFGNYFTDPENHDLNTFVEVIRIIQRFSNTTAFQNFGSKLNHRSMFGCEHETFDSNRYWICCLRSISITLHHQVGTAKMGPSEDSTTVVNPNLQVHGIKNLRVADCSIIPRAVGAHTNAPSIMVGEKASDIIKDYWGELQNSEL